MKTLAHQALDTGKIIALALALSIGVSYLFAWTGPTAPPPEGNVAAPVNVGSNAQAKLGGLSLGTTVLPVAPALLRVDCPSGDCSGKVLTAVDNLGNAVWQTGGGITVVVGGCFNQTVSILYKKVSGTYSWIVPNGTSRILVNLVGGGGGGGGGTMNNAPSGGGGGGGGYSSIIIDVTPGHTYSFDLGAGGSGGGGGSGPNGYYGAGGNGSSGGETNFKDGPTKLSIAGGGMGGGGNPGDNSNQLGGSGGTGNVNTGENGNNGIYPGGASGGVSGEYSYSDSGNGGRGGASNGRYNSESGLAGVVGSVEIKTEKSICIN
ncbi:MAG TPA: hypothetical protein VJH94_04200 [Candidatus Paceibacterota bacterium]